MALQKVMAIRENNSYLAGVHHSKSKIQVRIVIAYPSFSDIE